MSRRRYRYVPVVISGLDLLSKAPKSDFIELAQKAESRALASSLKALADGIFTDGSEPTPKHNKKRSGGL